VTPDGPELDDGADDDPSEPELDDDDDPELDDEPELADEPELVLPEPEVAPELAECPVLVLVPDDEAALVLPCAEAGSSAATTPTAATPRIPAPMVAARSRRRARSRDTTADTVRSSLFMKGLLSRKLTGSVSAPVICQRWAVPLRPL
jgi:hypothetical protein